MKIWGGLTRTEKGLLKTLRKNESTLASKYARMKQTIEDRHLDAESHLQATVGAELERVRAGIAELEAKQCDKVEV